MKEFIDVVIAVLLLYIYIASIIFTAGFLGWFITIIIYAITTYGFYVDFKEWDETNL
jgi:hypothetical protein